MTHLLVMSVVINFYHESYVCYSSPLMSCFYFCFDGYWGIACNAIYSLCKCDIPFNR